MKTLVATAAVLLTGSALADVLDRPPIMKLATSQPIDGLEQCIGLALRKIGGPNVVAGPGRRTMFFGAPGVSVAVVTLIGGQPNTVEVRQGLALNHALRERIRRCASGDVSR